MGKFLKDIDNIQMMFKVIPVGPELWATCWPSGAKQLHWLPHAASVKAHNLYLLYPLNVLFFCQPHIVMMQKTAPTIVMSRFPRILIINTRNENKYYN